MNSFSLVETACGRWWWEKVGQGTESQETCGLQREAAESAAVALTRLGFLCGVL